MACEFSIIAHYRRRRQNALDLIFHVINNILFHAKTISKRTARSLRPTSHHNGRYLRARARSTYSPTARRALPRHHAALTHDSARGSGYRRPPPRTFSHRKITSRRRRDSLLSAAAAAATTVFVVVVTRSRVPWSGIVLIA